MATSSITRNFVISGREQVEQFANAIEESANHISSPINISAKKIHGADELRKLMAKRKRTNEGI